MIYLVYTFIGIVTFSDHVTTNLKPIICTKANKNHARATVGNFRPGGSTNLHGGLLTGLTLAYKRSRRSSVLLFTDGNANSGTFRKKEQIITNIRSEVEMLSSHANTQVILSTFGFGNDHDEDFLSQLAKIAGGGKYNFLKENSDLSKFGHVIGDAMYTVAENIRLTITPENGVKIREVITIFPWEIVPGSQSYKIDIPSTADQQFRHILLKLVVPPSPMQTDHQSLFHVTILYENALKNQEERGEEYLFVSRTKDVDLSTRSLDVDEQLNRMNAARQIKLALDALAHNEKDKSSQLLYDAYHKIHTSDSKANTLSLCLCKDLETLLAQVTEGDLNAAKKALQDSLTSHWQEKGGASSCYVTRKEDKLITLLTSH